MSDIEEKISSLKVQKGYNPALQDATSYRDTPVTEEDAGIEKVAGMGAFGYSGGELYLDDAHDNFQVCIKKFMSEASKYHRASPFIAKHEIR